MGTLFEVVLSANKGDSDAKMAIINKFTPLIRKYARRIHGDSTDLVIAILEAIAILDENKLKDFASEGRLFSYIKTVVINRYSSVLKKTAIIDKKEAPLYEDFINNAESYQEGFDEKIYLAQLFSPLSELQRLILNMRVFGGMTDIEVAAELGVSRQAVNRAKNRAKGVLLKSLTY